MAVGTSIFLIALGAVLRFAVHVSTRGFSLHTIGLILILAGAVGLLISLLSMTLLARRREPAVARDDRAYPAERL